MNLVVAYDGSEPSKKALNKAMEVKEDRLG